MRVTRRWQNATALARYALGMAALTLSLGVQAASFDLSVVDGAGAPVSGFRWLLQEDTTYALDPASPPVIEKQLALNFHKSHHPLALNTNGQPLSGNIDADSLTVTNVAPGRYYLTVLPYAGHAMGGAPVVLGAAGTPPEVTVTVQEHPIPTAQIAVYLFHDCYPLNGAPDLPQEEAPAPNTPPADLSCPWATPDFTQFRVVVEEPGGKYGANGGPLLQDAFQSSDFQSEI